MKILEVAGSGEAGTRDAGPVTSTIVNLANGFAMRGHDVTVLDAPNGAPRTRLHASVNVQETDRLGAHGSVIASIVTPSSVARPALETIAALNAEHNFDVIHVHEAPYATALARTCAVPVLWTAHGSSWTMASRRAQGPRAYLHRWLDRRARRSAAHVVVLNEASRRALGGINVSVVPNGIDLEAWPALDRAAARRDLGICPAEFRVTFVGRIAPEKGAHVFAEAVGRARADVPVVADAIGSFSGRFGVSGRATEYARSVRANAPHVEFRGFIHRDTPEYRARLAAADAVVVPSITEPFGLVVLEALACGAWVIGSDVGGIRETLGGDTGALVPPGDASALARAIIERYQKQESISVPARARAAQFGWDGIADQYLALIGRLAGRR